MTASWGAYKDSPYEGFSRVSFIRSIFSTFFFYFLIVWILRMNGDVANQLVIMCAAIAFERIAQEFNKAFFRTHQREGIYKIPQSFHIFGNVVAYPQRLFLGIIVSVLIGIAVFYLAQIKVANNTWIYIGIGVAIIPSLGGAWKDAPIEGFEVKKFPRSFLIMVAAVALLHALTDNMLVLIMGAAGLERIAVEFYKTFIVSSTPGKFFAVVHHSEWLHKRKIFQYSYAAVFLAVLLTTIAVYR